MRIRRRSHLLAGALLLVFAVSAAAEVCPNPQVPKAERDQADQLLVLADTEQAEAIQTHLPFGTPACPKLLPQREYILCYDPVLRIGLWAGYRLRAEDVVSAPRKNAFRTDPRLTAPSPILLWRISYRPSMRSERALWQADSCPTPRV